MGDSGRNKLKGSNFDDFLSGLEGHDRLIGRNGDDTIFGGNGRDIVKGGRGNDTLWGGKGKDLFKFKASATKNGFDTIQDFESGKDKIHIGSMKKIQIKKINGSTMILSNNAAMLELAGFDGKIQKKGKFLI